jgi:hypothetical protein
MKRAVVLLVVLLGLTGCTATAAPAKTTPAVAEAPSISASSSLDELIAYGRSLSGSTPDLAEAVSEWTQYMSDAVAESDLPTMLRNSVNQDLTKLNADVQAEPSDAAAHLGDLNAILDEIEAA